MISFTSRSTRLWQEYSPKHCKEREAESWSLYSSVVWSSLHCTSSVLWCLYVWSRRPDLKDGPVANVWTASDGTTCQTVRLHVCSSVEWTEVGAAAASLQGCGMKDFTQLILSLRRWHWVLLILAFEVEPVEFTGDDRQSLSLGLGQKHAHVHRRQQADHRERYETVLLQSTLKKTDRSTVSVGGRELLGGVCGWTESWTDHQKRENHPNDEQVDPHHGSGDHVGCRPSGLVKDLCGQNPRHTSWGKTANTYIYTVY